MPLTAEALALMAAKGLTIQDAAEIAAAMEPAKKQTAGAIRQARYREKLSGKVTQSDVTVTRNSDASLSENPPPKSNNINPPDTSLRSDTVPVREAWFSDLWSAWPKRDGSNPKQPAAEKFYRLVKASPDPEILAQEIIDGARRYAASRVGEDPRFTVQLVVFLNQGRWKDEHLPASKPMNGNHTRAGPSGKSGSSFEAATDLLSEMRARREQTSRPRPDRDRPEILPAAPALPFR